MGTGTAFECDRCRQATVFPVEVSATAGRCSCGGRLRRGQKELPLVRYRCPNCKREQNEFYHESQNVICACHALMLIVPTRDDLDDMVDEHCCKKEAGCAGEAFPGTDKFNCSCSCEPCKNLMYPPEFSALAKNLEAKLHCRVSQLGCVDHGGCSCSCKICKSTAAAFDPVNRPAHYADRKIEVIDFIIDSGWGEGFCLGNAVKYVARAGKKDPDKKTEDLEKARWYLDRWIKEEKKAKEGKPK